VTDDFVASGLSSRAIGQVTGFMQTLPDRQ
jgi:hypothetical protein